MLGEIEDEALGDLLGEYDGLSLALGEIDGLAEGETDGEALGDTPDEGLADGDMLGE